jgi:uncharacterized membrane protein YfcA
MLAMVPAVLVGTSAGKVLLGRLSERVFMIVFKVMLISLALKLIVWDSAMRMLD